MSFVITCGNNNQLLFTPTLFQVFREENTQKWFTFPFFWNCAALSRPHRQVLLTGGTVERKGHMSRMLRRNLQKLFQPRVIFQHRSSEPHEIYVCSVNDTGLPLCAVLYTLFVFEDLHYVSMLFNNCRMILDKPTDACYVTTK